MNIKFYIIFSLFFLASCKKEQTSDAPNRGEITIQFDDSYVNVADALSYRYMQTYPDTKIKLDVQKEDQAIRNLLLDKTKLIIMSRELTEQEKEAYRLKTELELKQAYFAYDAVAFVVPKDSDKTEITEEEIKQMLLSKEKKLIFDGNNTSNLNNVVGRLKLDVNKINYTVIKGNENIINELDNYPSHIGVVSYNTFSRPFGETAIKLRDKIKVLSVKVGNKSIEPNKLTMKGQQYPFSKKLYFLTTEAHFGLANGLIRYSCTQIGQKIVAKQGLLPYYDIPRAVQMR